MELVVTSLALDYIVAATAPGAIVAFAGLQHVVPGKLAGNTGRIPVADQLVIADAAQQNVRSAAAFEEIIAIPAIEQVVALILTVDAVIVGCAVAEKLILAFAADQVIAAATADQIVVAIENRALRVMAEPGLRTTAVVVSAHRPALSRSRHAPPSSGPFQPGCAARFRKRGLAWAS